jgi:hypothetical protein
MFGAFTCGESYPAEAALVTAQPFGHGIRVRAGSDQLLRPTEIDDTLDTALGLDALGAARGADDRLEAASVTGETLGQAGGRP